MIHARVWLVLSTIASALACSTIPGTTSVPAYRSAAGGACTIGETCEGGVCMSGVEGPSCRPIPATAPIEFILPFEPGVEVVCTHASGEGSHSWPNAFYALDLATPYHRPASVIVAAADGVARVFSNGDGKLCPQPAGSASRAEADRCGNGWGNHVKIQHEGGYHSFYVHLERVLVRDGKRVSRGQPIGIEGWTGAAGHRHLHWSVQRSGQIEWDGESVPFRFRAHVGGIPQIIDTATFKCPHANIGQDPAQPRLSR